MSIKENLHGMGLAEEGIQSSACAIAAYMRLAQAFFAVPSRNQENY
jgi:hypothetical protein